LLFNVTGMGGFSSRPLFPSWVARQFFYGTVLALVVTTALAVPFSSSYNLVPGNIAPQDIRSPRNITYMSAILSLRAQEEAVRGTPEVYTSPDTALARQQIERARQVFAFLSAVRLDPYASDLQRQSWVLSVPELSDMPVLAVKTLLALPESNWNRVQLEVLQLLDQIMRQEEIRAEKLAAIRERVPVMVSLDLAQDEATAVSELVRRFLKPNVFFDAARTEVARQAVRDATGPVFSNFSSGEVVIREGSVISELDVELLEELGLNQGRQDLRDWAVAFFLACMGTVLLGLYFYRLQPELLYNSRMELMVVFLIGIFALMASLLIPGGELLPYLFPGAALAMLLSTIVGPVVAVGALVFLAGACGWIAGNSVEIAILVALSGLGAVLILPRYEQTTTIFRSALFAGLVQGLTAAVFAQAADSGAEPLDLAIKIAVCMVGGLIAGGLTLGGLFLLAPVFDLATTFRLMELSRPNHPLLQRLLRETPGTFHHTMMIASMAEQAAERIGANALLTRVGAYYHDIGKLLRPYFFVENQEGVSNPHDRLDPHTSVEILNSHVRDGMMLARQYQLPAQVRAFIPEHHGTMRASFFYQKALQAAGDSPELVNEADFRYPGPRPQSRETLLVMLADGCEAATRASRPTTPEELTRVVDSIFVHRIQDDQLEECPITLKELEIVKQTYIEVLRGAYHPRVQYPNLKS